MATAKKGGLGRGLDALFADVPVKEPAKKATTKVEENNIEENIQTK